MKAMTEIFEKTPEQCVKEDLIRQTLEAVASMLEKHETNEVYQFAMKKAAKLVRGMALKLVK